MAASRGAANAVMARRAVAAALALAALGALAARSDAQSILDFITFDGIDYIRWAEAPGRALVADDLGVEFAVVGCSFTEDRRGCPFGTDAAAAFMPTGSRIYAVKGYSTDFRLAAVWQEKIYLYQAWRNPRAHQLAERCRPPHGHDRSRRGGPAAGSRVRGAALLAHLLAHRWDDPGPAVLRGDARAHGRRSPPRGVHAHPRALPARLIQLGRLFVRARSRASLPAAARRPRPIA